MIHLERHRAVWLSDLHLGSPACRVGLLLDFLGQLDCETLYLVGDVIDVRSLRRRFFWPKSHTEVLQQLLRKAQLGTRIVYVPGNHDDDFRALAGMRFSGIEIARQCTHTTARGKRLLVMHGDELDSPNPHGASRVEYDAPAGFRFTRTKLLRGAASRPCAMPG